MSGQPPDLRAFEALADKKLKDPKASQSGTMFVVIALVAVLGGGGFMLMRSLNSGKDDRAILEVQKKFAPELARKSEMSPEGLKSLVDELFRLSGMTPAPGAVTMITAPLPKEYLITAPGQPERCKPGKMPPELAKLSAQQKSAYEGGAADCSANYAIVGFTYKGSDGTYEVVATHPQFKGP